MTEPFKRLRAALAERYTIERELGESHVSSTDSQYAPNIADVSIGPAVLEILELPDDDIFQRREPDRVAADGSRLTSLPRPLVEGVIADQVEVSAEARVMMNDVEVPLSAALSLLLDHFYGWHVVLSGRIDRRERATLARGEPYYHIDIVRHAGLAVRDRRHRTGDHVLDSCAVQRVKKESMDVRRRHPRTPPAPGQ